MRESIPNSPKGREHILNSYLMAPFLVSMAQSGINWRPPPPAHGKEAGKAPQGSHRDRNKQWLLSLQLQQSEKTQILAYFVGNWAGDQALPQADNPSRLLGAGKAPAVEAWLSPEPGKAQLSRAAPKCPRGWDFNKCCISELCALESVKFPDKQSWGALGWSPELLDRSFARAAPGEDIPSPGLSLGQAKGGLRPQAGGEA